MRNNRNNRDRSTGHRHTADRGRREGSSAGQLRFDGPVIIGRNSLREVLRRKPDQLLRVFLAESASSSRSELEDLLRRTSIPVEFCQPAQLDAATGSDSHQGVAGVLKPRNHPDLKDLLAEAASKPRSLVVMLDSIYDPHNLGAILRACECFGAAGVILSKNRGAGITPAVTKTSVGASEFVPITIVSNLAQSLQRALDVGFEGVAADVGGAAVSLAECSFSPLTVLVLGSEGEGVQPLLRKLCTHAVKIPMSGVIDSLNVSQAASILMYAWNLDGQKTDGQDTQLKVT